MIAKRAFCIEDIEASGSCLTYIGLPQSGAMLGVIALGHLSSRTLQLCLTKALWHGNKEAHA